MPYHGPAAGRDVAAPILGTVIQHDVEPGFTSLGQATARTMARNAARRGRLYRTLLVHGPPGAGKGAFVDDLLALLFCTAPVSERPCNACRGCRDARSRSHPDLVVGSPQLWREQRATGESIVAVARRWLLESAGAPVAGERRVVLVESADRANEQAQNALLKALEEPGPRQMFVLVADEPARLLPTIRSRAQSLRVGPVPRAELVAWLVDRERLPADQAEALARIADGLPGRAIGYARDHARVEWRRRIQAELLVLLERGRAERIASVRELVDATSALVDERSAPPVDPDGDAPRTSGAAQRQAALLVVDAWIGLNRDLLVAAADRPALAPAIQLVPEAATVAARLRPAELTAMAALLERIRDGLEQSAAPRLALEVAMLAWPRVANAAP